MAIDHRIPTLALFVSFFFQAEDGIRDGRVTGVQTCALPISTAGAWGRVLSTPASGRGTLVRKGSSRTIIRLIRFSSSRTFPGYRWRVRRSITDGGMVKPSRR